jgi:hypothetical protein
MNVAKVCVHPDRNPTARLDRCHEHALPFNPNSRCWGRAHRTQYQPRLFGVCLEPTHRRGLGGVCHCRSGIRSRRSRTGVASASRQPAAEIAAAQIKGKSLPLRLEYACSRWLKPDSLPCRIDHPGSRAWRSARLCRPLRAACSFLKSRSMRATRPDFAAGSDKT